MSSETPPPFARSSGPKNAKLAIVGEAFGEDEDLVKQPFIGKSGQELTRMLGEAGLQRQDIFMTNVLALRPKDNKVENLCVKKKDLPKGYSLSEIKSGHYLLPEYLPEIDRLKAELSAVNPNLIVALGNTACWALLQQTKISQIRGYTIDNRLVPGIKILPTYHPAAVLRDWSLRVITIADLIKAKHESGFAEIRRPRRCVLVDPTLKEIEDWIKEKPIDILSIDIETKIRQIEMISFARSPTEALVIPFLDKRKFAASYWATPGEEFCAWKWVKHLLEHPCPKVFQNGMFDLQYISRMGFKVRNCSEDTMLLHHSMFPEMQKGLGFLGSIYTGEQPWKLLRGKTEELKRDE